ncbi:Endonuclease YncB, thermonuclease family [Evansella caseinilytica]|uniref:Endonuclease YncB, thermonuclease family n=1 Tax=Evansella caseinilytica TaxID=1503961 RepID=A0A1H3UH26_9BACI|nr:thermonuclease family protein [Evansella caseinilytica]SDZ61763.1 Endonuclease YncB, thermonuclease family [Evansella caseinilytica]
MDMRNAVQVKVLLIVSVVVLVFPQLIGAAAFSAKSEAVTLAEWNFDAESPLTTGGTENNIGREMSLTGAAITGYATGNGSGSRAIASNGWNNSEESFWMISLNTAGYESVTLSSRQYGSNTGPRDFKVEYSLDGSIWEEVAHSTITVASNWSSGYLNGAVLPAKANNQEQVFIRWINTSNASVSGGTIGAAGTSRIDDVTVTGLPIGSGENPGIKTIKQARGMIGQEVTVEGIANVDQGRLQSNRFNLYIQDGEAGIQLFHFQPQQFPDVKAGDRIRATGMVSVYSGVTQLEVSEINILAIDQDFTAKNVELPLYQDPALADEYEGQLVTLEGYIRSIGEYFNGGVSIGIINEDFAGVDIRVWESTGIDLTRIEPNTWYEMTGISSKYYSTYQVLPRTNSDFKKLEDQKPPPTTADREYLAEVAAVVDGDTIRLASPVLGATNVRFLNIDTAETYHTVRNDLDQNQMDHGKRAGDHLRTMLKVGDTVVLRLGAEPFDAYGRLLAEVITLDGVNTNWQMVRDGMAVTYFIYPFEEETVQVYSDAVRLAREAQLGIWNSEDPLLEMPFVFRARERGDLLSRYVGNVVTKEYVAPNDYAIIPPEYRVFFTKDQAEGLGYRLLEPADRNTADAEKAVLSTCP